MTIAIISLLCAITLALYAITRRVLRNISERRAVNHLTAILFPLGTAQKENTIQDIERLTHSRFQRDELLDYFLKIKGLQTINLNDPVDFWTRRYLLQPTRIRLNYFEQVKLYETFLNYPEIQGKQDLIPSMTSIRATQQKKHEYV